MENTKILRIIILALFFLITPAYAYAYSVNTHSFLTDETINFYNRYFVENQIPDNVRDFLIDGSRHEESFPRQRNHFYDPVNNQGLEFMSRSGYASPVWAIDADKQNETKYKITAAIASILTAVKERRISALTTETNFTWNRAKRFYLQGDKEKAMYLLGHTLHLIQDASIPANTRNDLILRDDEMTYEFWTEKFTLNTKDFTLPKRLEPRVPFVLNDLQSYFYKLALFTNNNFYSKNTIGIQSYSKPISDVLEKDGEYWYRFGYNEEFGKYHLVWEKSPGNHNFLVNFKKNLSLHDKHKLISRDYWFLLSTKAVQHGAGVINLFFKEVKAIEDDPIKLAEFLSEGKEKKSFLSRTGDAIKGVVSGAADLIKETFAPSGGFEKVEEISLLEDTNGEADLVEGELVEKETTEFCSFDNASKVSQTTPLIINEVAWMGDNDDFRHEWIEFKNISEKQINIGGYQVIDKKEQIQFVFPSGATLSPGDFYLIEHSDDNSAPPEADGIYKGTLSNRDEEIKLFDIDCNVLDAVSADSNWPAGDNSTKQTMERGSNLTWHDSSEPGGTPKTKNSQQNISPEVFIKSTVGRGETITESGANFTPSGKVKLHFILPNGNEATIEITADENGNFKKLYTMPEDALLGNYIYYAVDTETGIESNRVEYFVTEQKESVSTETAVSEEKKGVTSTETITGTNKETFSICSYQTSELPSQETLIINEVAWMGSGSDYNNEWIELKNVSNNDLDLAGYQLIDKDDQIHITFATTTIPAGGFILLERNNNDSVSNKTADIIYTGSLKNSDEGLRLFNSNCNLLDEVIANPDWPEGNNNSKKTMERKDNLSWQTSNNIGGTPREENSTVRVYHSGGGGGGSPTPSDNDSDEDDNENEEKSYSKILISEIQTEGDTVRDEFIELFNPNDSSVNLNGWSLKKKTSGGNKSNLVSSLSNSIPAQGYFLIVPQISSSTPGYTGLASQDFEYSGSTYSIASNNTVLLYDPNGELSDKVGFGLAADYETTTTTNPEVGQSISRKSENDTDDNSTDFILTSPSPKNSETSGGFVSPEEWIENTENKDENSPPTAFFSYYPELPKENDQISFDASSSTDDGGIISYQWNFGDESFASSSIATTTHTYTPSGSYSVNLTVFDSENSSSTITKPIFIASAISGTEANHIVISEVMPGISGESEKEFIELYNPTDSDIDITGWSLERDKDKNTTSTEVLVDSFGTSTIPAHGFFLIKSQQYAELEADQVYTNKSHHLAYTNNGVILYDRNRLKIDDSFFDSTERGESWERKSFKDDICYAPQNNYEFEGNSCDSDVFSIRSEPNPQNSSSLPEPRSAPTSTELFSAEYSEENLKISFNWGIYEDSTGSTSTVSYEIKEYNSPGVVIHNSTTIGDSKSINEVGRDYTFSFQAFDKDGLGSEITTTTVSIPSFIDNFYVYKDPRVSPSNTYLADFYYSQYPFIPDFFTSSENHTRKAIVIYLNKDALKQNQITLFNDWDIPDSNQIISTIFDRCNGSTKSGRVIALADSLDDCGVYSELHSSMICYNQHSLNEDSHLLLKLASSIEEFSLSTNDYFTLAFYGYNTSSADRREFKLVAIDKTKYYFQTSLPEQSPPKLEGLISTALNDAYTRLLISWESATDPDTIDNKITYGISYSTTTDIGNNWQDVDTKENYQRQVSPDDKFLIAVRAKDDFGKTSNILTASWNYPTIIPVLAQTQFNNWSDGWGKVKWKASEFQPASFQSITPEDSITFNKFITKLRMKKHGGGPSYNSNLRLSILSSATTTDTPDFQNMITRAIKGPISDSNADEDFAFTFDNPVNLQADVKYWLVLDSPGPQDALFDNEWFNAIKTGGSAYENGEAGQGKYKGKNNTCGSSCVFSGNYSADWYFKLISD